MPLERGFFLCSFRHESIPAGAFPGDIPAAFFVPNEFSLFGTKIVPNKLNSLGTILEVCGGSVFYEVEGGVSACAVDGAADGSVDVGEFSLQYCG